MQAKGVCGIDGKVVQGFEGISLASILGQDGVPYFCSQMGGGEVEEVNESHCLAVGIAGDHAQLSVGIDVVLLAEDVFSQVVATEGDAACSYVPHRGVVLYGVE